MKYDLTKPCKTCPFRRSTNFDFPIARIKEIIEATSFGCHNTTTVLGRSCHHKSAQSCAGRMILLERANLPDQMMRIAERCGLYDREKLDMKNEDVFESIGDFVRERTR